MTEQVIIRSSSWAALFDCAYRWEGIHLLGLRNPVGGRMRLGTCVHHGTAVYDQSRIEGVGLSVDDAVGEFVDKLRTEEEDVRWDTDLSRREAEDIGLRLVMKYCQDVSPRYSFVAVELRPEPLTVDVPEHGVSIIITGQMDRTRARKGATGGIGVSDIKTGARAVQKDAADTKGHQIQLGLYELLAERSLKLKVTEPAEVIGMQTAGTARIASGYIHNARRGLLGTPESPGLIELAARMVSSGIFPPNPKSMLCGAKYCPRWDTCLYHE